ncbi:unnamed protein product [Meloidogyne enterolobii]|uniref:Uncharacterized protein n=1 Tax=Meloidogyne enterolobii TaxID=390850 RepID=A0ACB0YD96_MELEN
MVNRDVERQVMVHNWIRLDIGRRIWSKNVGKNRNSDQPLACTSCQFFEVRGKSTKYVLFNRISCAQFIKYLIQKLQIRKNGTPHRRHFPANLDQNFPLSS